MLFFRALLAFLALPTVVGGLFPWLLLGSDRWRMRGSVLGLPILLSGAGILFWCVRDFYVIGKGTLAPWDPPKKLVIAGLYRYMRNPMYVGVLAWVAGWSLISGSPILTAYAGERLDKYQLVQQGCILGCFSVRVREIGGRAIRAG
jgi:protein-S-isoprenylcysteine O-methyltransferase Ste14